MPNLTVGQLAEICDGRVEGDSDRLISGAATIEDATETDLSFAANAKALESAKSSRAGCLLVPHSFQSSGNSALIHVDDPRLAFTRAVSALYAKPKSPPGVHPTAIIANTATVAADCSIGAYVTIGNNATVGNGCKIGNHCSIGENAVIGENTIFHANVTLYDHVRIGARVILHSGCVIGADGFGFTLTGDHYEKFPQIGAVEVDDDVEIGANCCIDRAALGVTRIGKGTKLDNLVHVAHNCVIGQHVVVAAQTGFSGSVAVGDFAIIGGQAGIGEKAKIESRAIVGGKSGVLIAQKIEAGEPVWGIPARPLRQHLKGLANIGKLPKLREDLRRLKQKVEELEAARR
ncbi:MAG: UDP-3-O-(3-hydroxymyristoyl)glucosamine N-acyltransferase [Bryobacteraceae bacterium]